MIKTALQHWVLEQCIDVLFDNITLNFNVGFDKTKRFHVLEVLAIDNNGEPVRMYYMDGCIIHETKVAIVIISQTMGEAFSIPVPNKFTRIIQKKDIADMVMG